MSIVFEGVPILPRINPQEPILLPIRRITFIDHDGRLTRYHPILRVPSIHGLPRDILE